MGGGGGLFEDSTAFGFDYFASLHLIKIGSQNYQDIVNMACLARQNSLFESGPGEGTETQNIHHGLTSLLTVPMCTRLTYATGPALLSARPYICGSLSLSLSL